MKSGSSVVVDKEKLVSNPIEFQEAVDKYKKQGSTLDTMGHSLGGALATHMNRSNPKQVHENLSFSLGAGFAESFRTRPMNTWDYNHKRDVVSRVHFCQRSAKWTQSELCESNKSETCLECS